MKRHRLASIDQFPLELSHSVDVALDGRVCLAGECQNRPRLEPQQVAYPNVASRENRLDLDRSRVQRVEQGWRLAAAATVIDSRTCSEARRTRTDGTMS